MGDIARTEYDQNTIFNHNKNSFFYRSAQHNDRMPTPEECEGLDFESTAWITKCNKNNFENGNNPTDCMNVALCKNKKRVEELYGKKSDYSASGQLYLDNYKDYEKEYIDAINNSVGIIFLGYLIFNKFLKN